MIVTEAEDMHTFVAQEKLSSRRVGSSSPIGSERVGGNYFDAEAFRARPISSDHRDFVRQNSADLVACLQEPNSKQAVHRSRAKGCNSHGLPNVH
jgi:hypothetical protein